MTTDASPRRRTVVVLAVVLIVLIAFVVRLVDIQVVNAKENVANSMAYGMGVQRTLEGTRGSIVDAQGKTLAESDLTYDCQFSPENVRTVKRHTDADTTIEVTWPQMSDEIAAITGQSADEVRGIVSDALTADAHAQYALLKKGLSTQQYRELVALGADYISCTAQPSRTYPNGAVAGTLLGFVGSDGQPLAGLEKQDQSCLAPTLGTLQFQRGKDGVIIPGTQSEIPATDGGTLTLTIDLDLQWYMTQLARQATQQMHAKFATITVVDVKTGKIKAAAEYPGVDPNNINAPGSYRDGSHIFGWAFEPGSTFKGITASTLIDAGGQTPLSTAVVPDRKTFPNGARVSDATRHPTYNYTLAGVLIDSSNVGASTFSQRVSAQVRYDYLKKFGIGSGSVIQFPYQAQGLVHPASDWDNQMFYDTSYGQGLVTTVPELLGAYGAIVNDGVKTPLRLIESCTKADGEVVTPTVPKPERVISKKTSAEVREILENVAMQASYSKMIAVPGYRIGVKTGTGQIAENGHYKAGVYYTTMIGFAPADNPQYLVAVTLNEPTRVRSSSANAPTFQKAMTQVLKTYRVMPSTSKPTVLPKFG